MDRLYNVNVKGIFHCSKVGEILYGLRVLMCAAPQAAVKSMLADEKGGAILNLASIASLIGNCPLPNWMLKRAPRLSCCVILKV